MDLVIAIGISVVISAVLLGVGSNTDHSSHRTKTLRQIAKSRSWTFNAYSDYKHSSTYRVFDIFQQGSNPQCNNTMESTCTVNGKSYKFKMGDHRHTVTTDDGSHTNEFSYLCVHLPFTDSPDLFIRNDESAANLPAYSEAERVTFESSEFNKMYTVYSTSKRFAFDVVTPVAMNAMLNHPIPDMDIQGGIICVLDGRFPWRPEEFPHKLDSVLYFLNFFPEHVIDDLTDRIE